MSSKSIKCLRKYSSTSLFVCVNQTGDRILSINDVSMEGMTNVQAGVLLKNATGTISLQVMSQCLGGTKLHL